MYYYKFKTTIKSFIILENMTKSSPDNTLKSTIKWAQHAGSNNLQELLIFKTVITHYFNYKHIKKLM